MNLDNLNRAKVEILEKAFLRKVERNSEYSRRAFARDLGVSHTLLSLIASGKRKLSQSLAISMLEKLKLNQEERNIIALGFKIDIGEERNKISMETASFLSDWTHYAVLSLVEIPEFRWDSIWIAKRLGITAKKANITMERLKRLGLIEQDEQQCFRQKGAPIVVENTVASAAAKKFNRRLLKKAAESMEETDFSQRDLSSIVFACNPELMPYAVERIRNFRRTLCKELENLGEPKEVYALSVQFFPLSEKEPKNES